MGSKNGWNCQECTFHHSFPAPRCAMCGKLRVTKQQMRDFITGKTLRPANAAMNTRSSGHGADNNNRPESFQNQPAASSVVAKPTVAAARPSSSGSNCRIQNPYAKSKQRSNGTAARNAGNAKTGASSSALKPPAASTATGTIASIGFRPPSSNSQNPMAQHPMSVNNAVSLNTWENQQNSSARNSYAAAAGHQAMPLSSTARPLSSASTATRPQSSLNSNMTNGTISNSWDKRQNLGTANNYATLSHKASSTSAAVRAQSSYSTHHHQPTHGTPPTNGTAPNTWANQQNLGVTNNYAPLPPNARPLAQPPQNTRLPSHQNNSARVPRPSNHPPANQPQVKPTKTPFMIAAHKPAAVHYVPGPVPLDTNAASVWVYPVNKDYPVREYQRQMSETAILHNTIVSLPTGLGKTLVAAVVLYNFYRFFPEGKAVFLAPTLPLVNQQVTACYKIMGIPEKDTAVLTGKVSASRRNMLWNERRVFFCTPQTVQKDIMAERCPAKSIVCLVLDEAHRASGEYAYTKVVQQIEQAGGKFRILGLSATPGTNIKSIQKVIETLRISKIEVRLEDDPDVKNYIHERHHEMIVVKQISVVSTCERLVNDLIAPLLRRLRDGNGLSARWGNGATLAAYNVKMAREEYWNRSNKDHSMDGLFYAAEAFVRIRNELRMYGLGVTRTSLVKIRERPNNGIIARMINEKEFRAFWDAVMGASSSPGKESAEDRKLNNPKLMKLDAILKEHFERARACNESSRAIVFSNGRESVNEIVDVLSASQPLLRPRHFVGQSKATAGSGKQTSFTAGMKQKEQQHVIGEFRSGTFNVLVCTCVAEEGLDVGEVDLIVMFDSLQSPTRMIQRSGRTGRKRKGRVVYLVSEGQEEKKLKSSNLAQKTLGRALKDPSKFQVASIQPMFPQKPTLQEREMTLATTFHLSQVGGYERSERSRNGSNKKEPAIGSGRWKLTDEQEKQRYRRFGRINVLSQDYSDGSFVAFPISLRRTMLRARTRANSKGLGNHDKRRQKGKSVGVTASILREMEGTWNKEGPATPVNGTRRRSFMAKSRDYGVGAFSEKELFAQLFPLEKDDEESGVGGYEPDYDSVRLDRDDDQHAIDCFEDFQAPDNSNYEATMQETPRNGSADNGAVVVAASSPPHGDEETSSREQCTIPNEIVISSEVAADVNNEAGEFCLPTPPDSSSSSSGSEDSDEDEAECNVAEKTEATVTVSNGVTVCDCQKLPIDLEVAKPSSHNNDPENDNVSTPAPAGLDRQQDGTKGALSDQEVAIANDVGADGQCGVASDKVSQTQFLRLPTQDSSSSSEDDSSIESSQGNCADQKPAGMGIKPLHDDTEETDDLEQDHSFRTEQNTCTALSKADGRIEPMQETGDNNKTSGSSNHSTTEASNPPEETVPANTNEEAICAESGDVSERNDSLIGCEKGADGLDRVNQVCNNKVTGSDDVSQIGDGFRESPSNDAPDNSVTDAASSSLDDNNENPNVMVKPRAGKMRRDVLMSQTPVRQTGRTPNVATGGSMEATLADTPLNDQFPGPDAQDAIQGGSDKLAGKGGQQKKQILSWAVDTPTPQTSSTPDDLHLVDTPKHPDDVDDVVCNVCHAGHSTDDDPIVLCDGPENDYSCKTAVHKSCYQITVSLDDVDSWRCDPCELEFKRLRGAVSDSSAHNVKCSICSNSHGAFWHRPTSNSKGVWVHPTCRQWSVGDDDKSCEICRRKGAVACSADGCMRAAHPHCAVNATSSRRQWSLLQISQVDDVAEATASSLCLMFCGKDETYARDVLEQSGMDCSNIERLPKCVVIEAKSCQDGSVVSKHMATTAATEKEPVKPAAKRKRLKKKTRFDSTVEVCENSRSRAIAPEARLCIDGEDDKDSQAAKRQRVKKRIEERNQALYRSNFIDSEAGIASDEDPDGDRDEEAEALRIEEEELSHNSFINDTSQLGYTQDELDRADPEGSAETSSKNESTSLHRFVDIEYERNKLFATPVLNRRMRGKWARDAPTPHSAPSSQKGLGNMHFIRSVLEHHRMGGSADEIEQLYHQVAKDCSESKDEANHSPRYLASEDERNHASRPLPSVPRTVSDEDDSNATKENTEPKSQFAAPSTNNVAQPNLTEEHMAMIEAKRQEALRRRQQHLANLAASKR